MHDIIVVQNQFGVKAIHRFRDSRDLTLEEYFEALNGMGPNKGMRNLITMSLTARDYICIDGQWHYCAPLGWQEVNEEAMSAVIADVIVGEWDR